MLNQERRDAIVKIVEDKGSVSVIELTKILGASESTIRRDLLILANSGRVKKIHGGATLNKRQFVATEDSVSDKQVKNTEGKRKIAKYAAEQINDDDFIYLDAGTTTLYLIEYLKDDCGAAFVTNGVGHAKLLAKRGFNVSIIGGKLKGTTEAITGIEAATNMQYYNFTKAFIGANGISERQGYTTPDSEEAFVKRAAIDRAFVSYVLADSSKFDKVSQITFGGLDRACIITDEKPDDIFEKHTVVTVAE